MSDIMKYLTKKPWLLPFIAALLNGRGRPSEVADYLGCSRRLASTGLYALRKLRLAIKVKDRYSPTPGLVLCITRHGRWFVTRIGETYILAKIRRRTVKAYSIPASLLSEDESRLKGKIKYRVGVLKHVLDSATERIGCFESGRS